MSTTGIMERIDGLRDLMNERFENIENKLDNTQEDVGEMRTILIGNGKVGVLERLNTVEKDNLSRKDTSKRIMYGAIGALFTIATGVVLALINGWMGLP